MSLVSLSDVKLSYRLGDRVLPVLAQIDLNIEPGEMVAILGPSGSGKSSLLYILGCLLKSTSGSYRLAGHEVTMMSDDTLADLRSRAIGFIFQQFHLLPRANILENVLLGARYNQVDQRSSPQLEVAARELIERVGLSDYLHHHPNQLSGGQQQRVAIARALMNNPPLILADEPTGNLDSKSAAQVLEMLQEVHKLGHTVLIITHDQEVAKRCQRVVTIHDGVLKDKAIVQVSSGERLAKLEISPVGRPTESWYRKMNLASAFQNLWRNRGRSILTMLGVTIGIAAVLSTITLGSYTREKILEGYESLGSNKLIVRAYPRWRMTAKDVEAARFEGLDQVNDLLPMRRMFREIKMLSPVMTEWISSVEFGGQSIEEVQALGVSSEYFEITNRRILVGNLFSPYHIKNHSPVCIIGYEIATKLFGKRSPLQQVIQLNGNRDNRYSCRVMGVLASQSSNNEWNKPNLQVLLPDSFFAIMASKWSSKPYEINLQIESGSSIEDLSKKIKSYLKLKYGRSVMVTVDADQLLVAQMKTFLNLFATLLAGVAFISLAVGGIGITNMMLVSVTERIKEIGLRKALGAHNSEIFHQLIVEAVILCSVAGLIGILSGLIGYHSILYFSAQVFPKIKFEWVFNLPAIGLSTLCIVAVGVASGIIPALRAQKLEVVEALRNE